MPTHEPAECDFCRIAKGESVETPIICSAESWVAFFPLNPATPGHTLIIPRKHVTDLWQVEATQGHELMTAVIHVGRAIQAALQPDGMNMITSAGRIAEQTVFHLHLHLVPRWDQDGFGRIWPVEHRYRSATLSGVADRIRQACTAIR